MEVEEVILLTHLVSPRGFHTPLFTLLTHSRGALSTASPGKVTALADCLLTYSGQMSPSFSTTGLFKNGWGHPGLLMWSPGTVLRSRPSAACVSK